MSAVVGCTVVARVGGVGVVVVDLIVGDRGGGDFFWLLSLRPLTYICGTYSVSWRWSPLLISIISIGRSSPPEMKFRVANQARSLVV